MSKLLHWLIHRSCWWFRSSVRDPSQMRSPSALEIDIVAAVRATKTLSHRNTSATSRSAAVTCTLLVGQFRPTEISSCARMVRVWHRRRRHQPQRCSRRQGFRCRFTPRFHRSAALVERQPPACESRRPRRSPTIVVDRFKSKAMQWFPSAKARVRRNCDCAK